MFLHEKCEGTGNYFQKAFFLIRSIILKNKSGSKREIFCACKKKKKKKNGSFFTNQTKKGLRRQRRKYLGIKTSPLLTHQKEEAGGEKVGFDVRPNLHHFFKNASKKSNSHKNGGNKFYFDIFLKKTNISNAYAVGKASAAV